MRINIFGGELTDNSAKNEALDVYLCTGNTGEVNVCRYRWTGMPFRFQNSHAASIYEPEFVLADPSSVRIQVEYSLNRLSLDKSFWLSVPCTLCRGHSTISAQLYNIVRCPTCLFFRSTTPAVLCWSLNSSAVKIFSKLNYFIFGYFDPTNTFFW